ncbi:hypothetical protein ACU4GD_19620 [Cupriavidus basilensis]
MKVSNISPDALPSSAFPGEHDGRGRRPGLPAVQSHVADSLGYAAEGASRPASTRWRASIIGLRTGTIRLSRDNLGAPGKYSTWYEGGGPVAIRAGRDLVNAGTSLGEYELAPDGARGWYMPPRRGDGTFAEKPTAIESGSARGNLIVHDNADDVSVVSAGRDIRYSSFYVAGPGLLEVTAGRDLYMADQAELQEHRAGRRQR